jgi:two-component sensor histidine kinase
MKELNHFGIITRQLIFLLIVSAVFFILLISIITVVMTYNNQLETLENNLNNISIYSLDIINHSLWVFDDKQLEYSIKSILNIDGVVFVSIIAADGNRISFGQSREKGIQSLEYRLVYSYEGEDIYLGVLDVQYLLPRWLEIFITHISSIFLRVGFVVAFVLIIVFIIVNYFIVKPISILVHSIQIKDNYETLNISRTRLFKKHDEIDFLIDSFNETFSKIRQEINERRNHEIKLFEHVKEKNILLSEVHHRVKNNLQIILSLLNLQKNESNNIKESLNSTISRIRAMSVIHEQLYNSDNFSKISMHDYLISLVSDMSELSFDTTIKMVSAYSDMQVDLDTAIPLGLIINELILYSLNNSFPENYGLIELEILEDSEKFSNIRIKDNGVGINSIDDHKKSSNLGLNIVYGLVDQIDGKINIISDNGLSITISIPHN